MTKYLLAYRAPRGYVPGDEDATPAWAAFIESLGDHLVDPGNPVFNRTTVGDCGSDVGALGGFSIIEARDIESAATLAKGCPFVPIGGGVEVGEITELMAGPQSAG